MRLFVAVYPPAAEVAALAAAVGSRPWSGALRWGPTEQWHVTLVFCGEVEERVVPELSERLRRAAGRTAPFALRLAGAGTFPRQPTKARVLWAGLDGDVDALSRLAERCAAGARRCGIPVEERPFRPHLTLARARREPADAREAVDELSSYAGSTWPVTSFRLVRSTLGASVVHEPLDEFELTGHQA